MGILGAVGSLGAAMLGTLIKAPLFTIDKAMNGLGAYEGTPLSNTVTLGQPFGYTPR
jgi:hypothetical protein